MKMVQRDGDPYGTRTRVSAVKGQRPRPLDEGTISLLTGGLDTHQPSLGQPIFIFFSRRPHKRNIIKCYLHFIAAGPCVFFEFSSNMKPPPDTSLQNCTHWFISLSESHSFY